MNWLNYVQKKEREYVASVVNVMWNLSVPVPDQPTARSRASNKEKKMIVKSRNQREGKYVPGWCYNAKYTQKRDGSFKESERAGQRYNVKGYRNFNDGYATIPGITFVRSVREGAFE